MSLLLLLKPKIGVPVIPPTIVTAPVTGSKRTPPPQIERFLAGTARIFIRACQPSLILVPTAKTARLAFSASGAEWEQRLESEAKKSDKSVTYRATKDDRDFDEIVQTAYLLTR